MTRYIPGHSLKLFFNTASFPFISRSVFLVAVGASGSYYMDRLKSVLSVSVAFFAVVTASAVFFVVAAD